MSIGEIYNSILIELFQGLNGCLANKHNIKVNVSICNGGGVSLRAHVPKEQLHAVQEGFYCDLIVIQVNNFKEFK